jgi:hypothetical protein
MTNLKLFVCLGVVLSVAAPCLKAQTADESTADSRSDAKSATEFSAWVYVSSTPKNSSTSEIKAYTAAANGKLSSIAGSPFHENVTSMAVNGKYLMAVNQAKPDIDSFRIESNGALRYAASKDYAQFNDSFQVAVNVFFDRTGDSLYVGEYGSNDEIASFEADKSNGELKYLGQVETGFDPGSVSGYFLGNNVYAYSAGQAGCMYPGIYVEKRQRNGNLVDAGGVLPSPIPPDGVNEYYPEMAVTAPGNHVVIAEQPVNAPSCAPGPLQLAIYTADSSGNLTTTSTFEDMPAIENSVVSDMKMAPSGKLLAVGGAQGLEIFHFDGDKPITRDTGLLTTDPINEMFWDNDNHLYAISAKANKLLVYTITPSRHESAAGSPYAINEPGNLIVQSLPRN